MFLLLNVNRVLILRILLYYFLLLNSETKRICMLLNDKAKKYTKVKLSSRILSISLEISVSLSKALLMNIILRTPYMNFVKQC